MFDIVAKLLMHRQLSFDEGSIKLLGHDVVIFPLDNLVDIQRIVENAGREQELYLASKKLGADWIRIMLQKYKMDKLEEQVKWGENVIALAGLGKMKITSWDVESKTMVYRVYNSKVAKLYGRVGRAVDLMPRGWFAGASSVFFRTDIDAVEIKCYSKGDEFCEFIVKPLNTFDFDNEAVKVQLGMLLKPNRDSNR